MEIPKVVFVDWNKTLSDSKFWEHLRDPLHPSSNIHPIIVSSIFESYAPLKDKIRPWMRGQYTSEDMVALIAQETGLNSAILLEELKFSCQNMRFVDPMVPDLVKLIQNKGVKVVIATDNMDTFTRWTVPAMNLARLFDDIINSFYRRALKGDKDEQGKSKFFADYLAINQINPGESLIIDDSPDADNSIKKSGISYHQITPVVGLVPKLQEIIYSL